MRRQRMERGLVERIDNHFRQSGETPRRVIHVEPAYLVQFVDWLANPFALRLASVA